MHQKHHPYLLVALSLRKRQCKLQISASRFGSRTLFAVSSLSSNSLSRFNKFSTNLRTHDTIASEADLTLSIENISGTRFVFLLSSDTSLWLLLIATKQENNELGFSLLEPSCLKPSTKFFTDAKNRSQNSQPNS